MSFCYTNDKKRWDVSSKEDERSKQAFDSLRSRLSVMPSSHADFIEGKHVDCTRNVFSNNFVGFRFFISYTVNLINLT